MFCFYAGIFYFAGHGFKKDEVSYMIPVQMPRNSAGDGESMIGFSCDDCLSVSTVLNQMQNTKSALNLLMFDMCRREEE